jgi:hypothetical protein
LRLLQLARLVARVEGRLGHLADAFALLTETSETGFRAVANEIERLSDAGIRRRPARTSHARVVTSARRGRSVQQIAVAEQVSEGEVRLRLHLAEQARTDRVHDKAPAARPRQEQADGQVRE